jgi:hypothetical protein
MGTGSICQIQGGFRGADRPQRDKDKIAGVIQPLAEKLTNAKWRVYIDREQWYRWQEGEAKEIEFHALYDVAEFARFKSVTILSANLYDSIMYNLLKTRYGYGSA